MHYSIWMLMRQYLLIKNSVYRISIFLTLIDEETSKAVIDEQFVQKDRIGSSSINHCMDQ